VPQDVTKQTKQNKKKNKREMDWATGCSEMKSLKMWHFCSDVKPQSSEFEPFSKEQELGKFLTGEGFCFF